METGKSAETKYTLGRACPCERAEFLYHCFNAPDDLLSELLQRRGSRSKSMAKFGAEDSF
jgi:hypothetical protein